MSMNIEVDNREPLIIVLEKRLNGEEMTVVDMAKCDRKWFYNENGEYVHEDTVR